VAARRELVHVGTALRVALANPDASASTLNALAWVSATADVFLDEALAAAERAVRLAPDDAGIADTLAEVHFRRGDRDRAVEVIDRAIALDPEVAYYREQRARFLDDETGTGGGTP
jgi:tetratricopeptide (TPR) repeat protein